MAIITILLSCALGAIAGLFQLAFLGASLGQAFLTYMMVSLILSASAIGLAVVITMLRTTEPGSAQGSQDEMESWQDWRTEEAMESDRIMRTAEMTNGRVHTRQSDSPPVLHSCRMAEATAYSVRRADKV